MNHKNKTVHQTALLFVDDRPCTLAEALFQRSDVKPILLRFQQILEDLPPIYQEQTQHFLSFVVDMEKPISQEVKRFQDWQEQHNFELKYFCNPSEPRQHISQRFARLLGLPALSKSQVDWLRNKLSMKKKCKEIGFLVADFAPVFTPNDVLAFAQSHGWPVVVKPKEGFACIDTYKLEGEKDIKKLKLGSNHEWMVESFVWGEEYECCVLIFKGQVLDAYLSYFPAPPLEATDGAINANISLGYLNKDFPTNMKQIVQQIVDGMDIDHGYMHLEFFLLPDQTVVLSEVGLRLAGCEIPANHGFAYGFNIFDALIDIHLGRQPKLEYTQERCVGDLLLPIKPGRVEAITSVSDLLAMEGVIKAKLKIAVGDSISTRRASHFSSGYVHVEGKTVFEVEYRMQRILERFHLKTTDG